MEFLYKAAEVLLSVPFIIRVLLALASILLFNKLFNNLLGAMTFGTVLLAFWTGHTPYEIAAVSSTRFFDTSNLYLMLIIILILLFSAQMKHTGMMERLVTSVRRMSSPKVSIAVLPALIGLLPMPGGAIFSAPLVEETDRGRRIDPVRKTAINYWFRHMWEYWWPLYPGVLLAAEISGIGLYRFMVLMFPLTLISVVAGILLLLYGIDRKSDLRSHPAAHFGELWYSLQPLTLLVTVTIAVKIAGSFLVQMNAYIPIAAGSSAAIAFLQYRNPLSSGIWKKTVLSVKTLHLLLLVAVIRIFGAFIESPLPAGGYLMDAVRDEFSALGIPVILTVMGIPFICGISTGIAVGFVGASFPIVVSLLGSSPDTAELFATAVLAYGSGYAGMILSPVHVCLIVSNEYFQTRLLHSLRYLVLPSIAVIAGSLLLHLLYR